MLLFLGCMGADKDVVEATDTSRLETEDTELVWEDTGWEEGLHIEGPDFTPVAPGCSVEGTITLRNGGPMHLSMAVLADAPFSAETTQLELAVGDQAELTITFAPSDEGTHSGSLWLSGTATLALPLEAISREPSRTEVALSPGAGDVVLVVDTSGNMKDKADPVLEQIDTLLSLEGEVYLVTEDMGTLHLVTSLEEARTTLETTPGGMFSEALFVLAKNAAAAESLASPVHFVFISDEPEQSPSALGGSEGMTNQVWRHRPDARFHAFVGPLPDGGDCADAGVGYHQAVLRAEGVVADLCNEDLASEMAAVRLATKQPLTWFYAGDDEGNPLAEANLMVDGQPGELTHEGAFVHFDALPLNSEVVFTTSDTLTCD
jgi:hypothetical protein